jgi:hypothetical protein
LLNGSPLLSFIFFADGAVKNGRKSFRIKRGIDDKEICMSGCGLGDRPAPPTIQETGLAGVNLRLLIPHFWSSS